MIILWEKTDEEGDVRTTSAIRRPFLHDLRIADVVHKKVRHELSSPEGGAQTTAYRRPPEREGGGCLNLARPRYNRPRLRADFVDGVALVGKSSTCLSTAAERMQRNGCRRRRRQHSNCTHILPPARMPHCFTNTMHCSINMNRKSRWEEC